MKCGVGDYTRSLTTALAALPSMKVGVLTNRDAQDAVGANPIALFPIVSRWNLHATTEVIQIYRQWAPDIVHIQYPTQGYGQFLLPWLLPIISLAMGKKLLQTWHERIGGRYAPLFLLNAVIPGSLIVVRPNYRETLPGMFRWILRKKTFTLIRNASSIPRVELGAQERQLLRSKYLGGQNRLIVFFGFAYHHKGIDLIFDIAEPASDHIVIIGELSQAGTAIHELIRHNQTERWLGKLTLTGFLPSNQVAALLAASDAVILPFRTGGGNWNTSIHAAVLQGTFVITTSITRNGYDRKRNVYYAKVEDVHEMKSALDNHAGERRAYNQEIDRDEWSRIAAEHFSLYSSLLTE